VHEFADRNRAAVCLDLLTVGANQFDGHLCCLSSFGVESDLRDVQSMLYNASWLARGPRKYSLTSRCRRDHHLVLSPSLLNGEGGFDLRGADVLVSLINGNFYINQSR
jgi:hypothetical protein